MRGPIYSIFSALVFGLLFKLNLGIGGRKKVTGLNDRVRGHAKSAIRQPTDTKTNEVFNYSILDNLNQNTTLIFEGNIILSLGERAYRMCSNIVISHLSARYWGTR
ncbi:hypothetical protein V1522DRAFT_413334 [Lipomyces starkeyi]